MRIKSRLVNRIIDKADAAFTWSSKILPPPKPIRWLRLRLSRYSYTVSQLDVAVAILAILMGLGFWWYYGHWTMFVATLLVTAMLWIWML